MRVSNGLASNRYNSNRNTELQTLFALISDYAMNRSRESIIIMISLAALLVGVLAWLAPFNPIGRSAISGTLGGSLGPAQANANDSQQATYIPIQPPRQIIPRQT